MRPTLNSSSTMLMNEAQVLRFRAALRHALKLTIPLLVPFILFSLTSATALADPDSTWVKDKYHKGDFKLVYGTQAADILVSPEDFKVVKLAASDLAEDIGSVTGRKPVLRTGAAALSEREVVL